jgi:hypothetical protein
LLSPVPHSLSCDWLAVVRVTGIARGVGQQSQTLVNSPWIILPKPGIALFLEARRFWTLCTFHSPSFLPCCCFLFSRCASSLSWLVCNILTGIMADNDEQEVHESFQTFSSDDEDSGKRSKKKKKGSSGSFQSMGTYQATEML